MLTKLSLLVLAGASLAACQTTPRWDAQFGQSVRAAVASQTIAPTAAANRDPVAGVDAQAALGAQHRYERSFAQPESPQPALIITSGK